MKIFETYIGKDATPYLDVVMDMPHTADGTAVSGPEDLYKIAVALKCHLFAEEHIYMVAFDGANVVIGIAEISRGGADWSAGSPREFFQKALLLGAVKTAMWHNHPSGNLTPSQEDAVFTEKLKKAGEILNIPLIEHLIVSKNGYHSFLEQGLLK